MASLKEIVKYTDRFLGISSFRDYCPNGLQIEGKQEVNKIVSGVTANQAFLDAAAKRQADLVLVHHGFFWKGENPCITGMKFQRIQTLIQHHMSLLAYHLPLDAHTEVGNNVVLGKQLEFELEGVVDHGAGKDILFYGKLSKSMGINEFANHIETKLDRMPLVIEGGCKEIKRIAWCTGAAQNLFEAAIGLDVDAYLSGEISEQTTHIASESGVHFIAAGHHATERYGAPALGAHLAEKFKIQHEFVDIVNPV